MVHMYKVYTYVGYIIVLCRSECEYGVYYIHKLGSCFAIVPTGGWSVRYKPF